MNSRIVYKKGDLTEASEKVITEEYDMKFIVYDL